MSQLVLKATKRDPGTKAARELRRNDRVPGVYYANNQQPVHFSVPILSLRPIVYTAEAKLVRLEVDNDPGLDCILKHVAFDPVSDKIVHFDLLGVTGDVAIAVDIPVHITGISPGVRDGGVMEHVLHKLHVRVNPREMPEHISVDVTGLELNTAIHVSDLNVPGVEFIHKGDEVIVACHPPRAAETTTPGAAASGESSASSEA